MKKFRTIFAFEYTNYAKTKGFIVITLLFILIIAVGASIPTISRLFKSDADTEPSTPDSYAGAGSFTGGEKNARIAADKDLYTPEVLARYFPGYQWTYAESLGDAQADIENELLDFAIEIDGLNFTIYEVEDDMFSMSGYGAAVNLVRDVYQMRELSLLGLSEQEAAEFMRVSPVGTNIRVGKSHQETFWIGYVMIMLTYMVTLIYGQFVSTSVVVEKSSKAMEILVTSAKPFELMMGKVLGVGAAGLTQFGCIILTALVAIRLNITAWRDFAPVVASVFEMSLSPEILIYAVVFFLLGFFTFAFILAGFASTVSKMEEMSSVSTMPMMLFVAAFMVSIFGAMTPNAGYVFVTSFIPMLSPMVMYMRICTSDVPIIQIVAAIVINIATVALAAFICSRIYRVGVMLYGKKPTLKQIISYIGKA